MTNLFSRLFPSRRANDPHPGEAGAKAAATPRPNRGPVAHTGSSVDDLTRILDDDRQWLHAQDPETHRQWQYLRNLLPADEVVPRHVPAPRYVRILRPVLLAGILATVGGVVAILHLSSPDNALVYTTGKGEMSTVDLADSSKVVLNHTSELIVNRHDPDESRAVRLKGEAFFRVKQTGTPFVIETSSGSVEVLGTEFNIRDRRGRLEVAVRTGTVRVVVDREGGEQATLRPAGMMVTVPPGGTASAPEPIMYEDYPGWLHGKLLFQKTPLAAVCEELEARFNINVRVDHP
ncbi:MAG TPA: FecR domain-containing protein, partial [Bacteroidota bacterium]|nr:FecR domain-containing protein [Bacteroidota bacterium]